MGPQVDPSEDGRSSYKQLPDKTGEAFETECRNEMPDACGN
jgi:hypothetical protein